MSITIIISFIFLIGVLIFVWRLNSFLNRRLNDIDGFAGVMDDPSNRSENVVFYFK